MTSATRKTESWKLIGMIQKRQRQRGERQVIDSEIVSALGRKGPENIPESTRPSSRKQAWDRNWVTAFLAWLTFGLCALQLVPWLNEAGPIFSMLAMISAISLALTVLRQTENRPQAETLQYSRMRSEIELLHDQNWELQEREHRHRTLVEAFGDMIMDRRPDGTIAYINPAFARFLGMSEEELAGQYFPLDKRADSCEVGNAAGTRIEEVFVEIGDEKRWLAWLDLPIRTEGTNESSLRTVARDITRQKEVELELRAAHQKAESASEAKTRFLANVSHEMRTPLNGILGMSGLLADTRLTAEQTTYVNAVHDSGVALLTLIEDILDMTLVEAGRLEFRHGTVSPHRLVEDVCELLASRTHAKGIAIGSHVAANIPQMVETDSGRLRQVLINLIGNAIKFTEKGGVFIDLKAGSTEGCEGGKVRLDFAISDTGPGIAERDQKLIFEEFSQADSKSTRQHGGAGLGLTISRRIIEEMGGQISVSSTIGSGSCFSFHVLVNPVADEAPEKSPASIDLKNFRIGIVGEDAMTERAIKTYLSEGGANACAFASVREAKEHLAKEAPDVLMVSSSSIGECYQSRDLMRTDYRKIILLKPEERMELQAFLDKGFDGYLIKPLRKISLMNLVVGHSSSERDGREISRAEKWASPEVMNDQPRSILLAEDNDINALLARTILEKAGHRVSRAVNGAEAISMIREREGEDMFDLVFLDLQMPVMDGLEALAEIRQLEADGVTGHIPVFILTADEQEETRQKSIESGVEGFLTKPLDPATLLETVSVTNS